MGLGNPLAVVHAQTAFDYSLSNTGGITLLPGRSGSTNITATLLAGTPSNVTLSCVDATLPLGASCSFSPKSIIANFTGDGSILTIATPASLPYGSYNVSITASPVEGLISPTNVTLTVAAKVAIDPTGRSLIGYHGSVSYQVNITGVPPFSVFIVAIHYNNLILGNPVVEYGGNVLGTDTQTLSECVDGRANPGDPNSPPCTAIVGVDGPGVVSLQLITANGENSTGNPTNGKLFSVAFDALGSGFSSIHILYQQIGSVTNSTGGIQRASIPVDGYFANVECGGNACLPPTASFRPLTRAVAGKSVTFVATSVSQNCCPKANITFYQWFFGASASITFIKSKNPNATVFYSQASVDLPVTLLVNDTYGATVEVTNFITVIRIWTDLGVLPLTVGQVRGVLPGTVNRIKVSVINFGVDPENSSVRLLLNDNLLTTSQIENLLPSSQAGLTYSWNTAGFVPRVYRIQAILDPVRDAKTGLIVENDTDPTTLKDPNGIATAYVQLILSLPSSFGLFLGIGLPQTIALGIIVLAAIGFALTFVRRVAARRRQPL